MVVGRMVIGWGASREWNQIIESVSVFDHLGFFFTMESAEVVRAGS